MNYQSCWNEKAKKIPYDILERLHPLTRLDQSGHRVGQRALLTGKGTEFFASALYNSFPTPSISDLSQWKIFIINAEEITNKTELSDLPVALFPQKEGKTGKIIPLKGTSIDLLSSLPAKTFDLIISLWDMSFYSYNTLPYIQGVYCCLKKSGRFCIVTYLDGSPELPYFLLKKAISNKKIPLKITKSSLPLSPSGFRKILNKAGLGDVRIWKDKVVCIYNNTTELCNDIFAQPLQDKGGGGGMENLFLDRLSHKYTDTLKEGFVREANKLKFPLQINYDFLGAVGVRAE
ncbi:MAG: hypothetical protein QME51_02975 [Planctomycetota bacterium]|nr:hypothetical protein [Planctomycetota bacterium]MDI6787316.1 hypothetical protein [Planctomycetota bacterium]